MLLTPVRTIEDDVYSTQIKPTSLGTTSMTEEEEKALLIDHPQILNYADITFEDKFKVVSGLPVITDELDGITVKIENLINQKFTVDENLNITFSFNSNKVTDSEVDGVVFTTKQQVAQAKAILFETKILARIKVLLETARAHLNDYEVTNEVAL